MKKIEDFSTDLSFFPQKEKQKTPKQATISEKETPLAKNMVMGSSSFPVCRNSSMGGSKMTNSSSARLGHTNVGGTTFSRDKCLKDPIFHSSLVMRF